MTEDEKSDRTAAPDAKEYHKKHQIHDDADNAEHEEEAKSDRLMPPLLR
jgi:hypothetical protein